MKRLLMVGALLLVVGAAVTLVSGQDDKKPAAGTAPAATQPGKIDISKNPDRISYAIGMKVASDISQGGLSINAEAFTAGFADTIAGKSKMSNDEMMQTMMAAQKEMMEKMQAEYKKSGEKNKAEGLAYLAKNKTAEGVKTTGSGLQYKVIKEGAGKTAGLNDTVTVKYRGTLTNGTEFDNSEKHGGTVSFPVGGVVPGWTEALQLMKVGSKLQLAIPSELAYGEQGAGRDIGPNSVLLFDIELVEIKAGDAPDAKK